jgi:large subunit ribosomal protein L24
MSLRIRKGDLVQVISGSDRGKKGRVLALNAQGDRVRVEGIRLQKKHLKPGRQGNQAGGIVEREGFIHISNVMLVDPKSGGPSRVRAVVDADGAKTRVAIKSGETVSNPLT